MANNVAALKATLTKEWNSGEYKTRSAFLTWIGSKWCNEHHISSMDYACYYAGHVNKLFTTNPTPHLHPKQYHDRTVAFSTAKRQHDKWYVYFYFIGHGLYYIGKTYDLRGRFNAHKSENDQFRKVEHILYMVFDTESDALDFERYYTRYFQPEWNISNRVEPSQLYKFPEQPIYAWVNSAHDPYKEAVYCKNTLIPLFQQQIHSVSAA